MRISDWSSDVCSSDLIASTLSIGIAGERTANVRSERLPGIRGIIEAGSASVGMFGLGFHAFNIIKRPGELTFGNFFYGAPIGAPAALDRKSTRLNSSH